MAREIISRPERRPVPGTVVCPKCGHAATCASTRKMIRKYKCTNRRCKHKWKMPRKFFPQNG